MFKLMEPHEPCDWPVTVFVPQHQGKVAKANFTASFRFLASDEFQELAGQGDTMLLERVLVGWDQVKDEAGEDLPYSDEARARMLQITYVRKALVLAYGEFIQGRAAKN